jgi:hypothetical protein
MPTQKHKTGYHGRSRLSSEKEAFKQGFPEPGRVYWKHLHLWTTLRAHEISDFFFFWLICKVDKRIKGKKG